MIAIGDINLDNVVLGLLCLLLAACQSEGPVTPSVLVNSAPTTTVTVPLPTPCVDPKDIPPPVKTAMQARGADPARQSAGASADYRKLSSDNAKMRAMLLACANAVPAK